MSESQTKSSSSQGMKVTDRRMFTAEGELRDEYRHLGEEGSPTESARPSDPEPPKQEPTTREEAPRHPETQQDQQAESQEAGADQASFYDLVSLLAEHASIYLRQGSVPGGDAEQNMELCKLHIDLLAVLENKTSGNLDPREQAMLEDVLYRLRLAFTSQRRGF